MSDVQSTVSYEQLLAVKKDIDELVPGYYIQELDSLRSLESGQGNCYTKNILAAARLATEYGVDASICWPSNRHALPPEINPFTGKPKTIEDSKSSKMTALQIAHTALVVPQGGGKHDILQLVYGMHTVPGKAFQLEEVGQISEYNSVSNSANRANDAMLEVRDDGVVVPTEYGVSEGLVSGDWQEFGDEYLRQLNLTPNDYDEIEKGVAYYVRHHLSPCARDYRNHASL